MKEESQTLNKLGSAFADELKKFVECQVKLQWNENILAQSLVIWFFLK